MGSSVSQRPEHDKKMQESWIGSFCLMSTWDVRASHVLGLTPLALLVDQGVFSLHNSTSPSLIINHAYTYICVCISESVIVTWACLTLCTPVNCNCQVPLSMEFSRQEYWSGLPFPSPVCVYIYIYIHTHTHTQTHTHTIGTAGEGNGNPFQYSCLENPMDRGAWAATVHRVIKNWT